MYKFYVCSFGKSFVNMHNTNAPTLRRVVRIFRAARARYPNAKFSVHCTVYYRRYLAFGCQLKVNKFTAVMWGFGHSRG